MSKKVVSAAISVTIVFSAFRHWQRTGMYILQVGLQRKMTDMRLRRIMYLQMIQHFMQNGELLVHDGQLNVSFRA